MLINGTIPNLFNGVSQQPGPLRHPSQAEAEENVYPAIATGLRKRPPTTAIARLTSSSYPNAYVHTINRDATERYTVIIDNGVLKVFDFTGTQMTVNLTAGTAYLACTTARAEFAVITVADYSFIVNKNFTVASSGATAGSVVGAKAKFTDLPAPAGTNGIWHILGDPSNNFDDYYVQDSAAAGNVYIECALPGLALTLDPATMPHKLTRVSPGVFAFEAITWDSRLVGDDDSNPVSSLVGRKIRDVFFHRNRLGFTADESICMSRAGKFFNFFIQTVTAIIDTDPIDRDVSHNKVSILNYTVPFNKTLVMFSNETQFQVTSGDTLTPQNVKADMLTEFESSDECRPVPMGTDLFFTQSKGEYTGVREYFVDYDTISNDASDVTAHVPTYIPKHVFKIASCSTEDALFLLTTAERNALYLYKSYWGKTEKLQSAWCKWTFNSGDTILNVDFIKTTGYVTVQRSDGIHFEKFELQANAMDTGLLFQVLLDRRRELTGVYNAGTNLTTWTLPYADSDTLQVVLGSSFGANSGSLVSPITRPSSTTIAATGDYSAGIAYVGRPYTALHRFSPLFYRDTKSAVQIGTLQLHHMYLSYDKTGYFRAEVTPKARDTNTYPFTGKVQGDSTLVLGEPALHSGVFKFPIASSNLGLTIDIINDSHLPSSIQSADWEGEYTVFSHRTGS